MQDQQLMSKADKAELLDRILIRAAEQLGDLHEPVMQAYYARFPEAVEMFEVESAGHRHKLEGEMIASVLYCIMAWIDRPIEIEIIFASTVPHHGAALHVPVACFSGFIDAVIDQIASTAPPEGAEAGLLAEIRTGLHRTTDMAARPYQLA
jgi:hypothetical protein